MDKQMIFKTAVMGGFDKASVNNYIEQIVAQAKTNEEMLVKKMEDLHESNKELKNKNEVISSEIKIVREQLKEKEGLLEKESAKLNRAESMIESLKNDVLKYSKLVEKSSIELETQMRKNKELSNRIDGCIEKNKKYESSVMQIGSAMLEAQRKSEGIIVDAQNKASKISQEADNILQLAADKLDSFKVDVANLKEIIGLHTNKLIERIEQIDEAVETVQNKFVNHYIDTKNIIDPVSEKYNQSKEDFNINENEEEF